MSSVPSLEETLNQITNGASAVRSAGESLTNRIRLFEAWVAKLPGRLEAECEIGRDPDGDESTHLMLQRDGKDWSLYIVERDASPHYDIPRVTSRKPLRDASIFEKAWGLENIARLLAAIPSRQELVVLQAGRAVATFDNLAKTIGLKEGV